MTRNLSGWSPQQELQQYATADGSVAFQAPAHIVTVSKANSFATS
jgi:hypothetical protein